MRWWPRGKRSRRGLEEAEEAVRAADNSHATAERDLRGELSHQGEAVRLREDLQRHNAADRYDDWLATIVGK